MLLFNIIVIVCSLLLCVLVLSAIYIWLIRPWHLRWGTTPDEMNAALPGDDIVESPKSEATHAITINAAPSDVWPWLVQLGQDRAGFYSYTWLENLFGCHMRNTYHIVPQWQQLEKGDGVLFHPKLPRVPIAEFSPNQFLVIGGLLDAKTGLPAAKGTDPSVCGATGWAFVLKEDGEGRTRLIVRLRGRWTKSVWMWLVNRLFWEPAHFIMERKMLLTIKRLAETTQPQKTSTTAKQREVANAC